MRGLLSYDGTLNRILIKLTECICLSLLWIVCSIPLVTIGASSTSLYYAVNKVIRHGRSGIWREFWSAFRSNFKQATIVWLLLVPVYLLMIASCYSAYLMNALVGGASKILLIIILVLIAGVTMWGNYLFPCIARFNNTTKEILKNSGWITLLNFGWSILLLVLFVVSAIGSLYIPVGLLLMPAGYALVSSYILERVFRKYMTLEDLAAEDERNMINEE